VKKRIWIIFLALLLSSQTSFGGEIKVENFKTEMLVNPLGIGTQNPHLSWQISGTERGIFQTYFHIIVASTPELLKENTGDIWDSGKVKSDKSVNVVFEGRPLKSEETCYWKVKIWTGEKESDWSQPAFWSVGLLYENEWKGNWIGFDHAFPWDDEGVFPRLSARYFRKEFEVNKQVKSAKAYIVGLGLYELYFNGKKMGDQVLAPTPTDFSKNIKYNVFDVTGDIQRGKNAVGTILGNGKFYTCRKYKFYKIKDFGYPKMLFQLEVN